MSNNNSDKKMEIKHLNSLVSLEAWLVENLVSYPSGTKVSGQHMLVFLEYLKRRVEDSRDLNNRTEWKKTIDGLESRQKSLLDKVDE